MIINHESKIINLKIVYFGPAMSGKTTTVKWLFGHFGKKDEIESIDSTVGRTLFFDYGKIAFKEQDWILNLHVYSTTGQDFYAVTRPITLKATDGIIFVLDSQRSAYERNLYSWRELESYYQESLLNLPKIIAFNKQDVLNKFTTKEFLDAIDYEKYDNIDIKHTIAPNGEGVLDSFEGILQLILNKLILNN